MDRFRNIPERVRHAVVATALLVLAGAAGALDRGEAAGGKRYLSGGIGQEEVAALQLARSQYSLAVRTALRGSGEYLADVHLRIADAQGRVIFEQDLGGPWLLIDLGPGRYTLQASNRGELQSRTVTIPARGGREVVFHFAAGGESPAATDAAEHLRKGATQ